jgi:imidazolonepropionase-like amidohydrolase
MQRAGVGLLAGTDAGDPYRLPGLSLHDELAELVSAGLTPLQALQSATRNAGVFLGQPTKIGTITVGSQADLVLLDADPLLDIHNTRAINAVIVRGQLYDHAQRERLLAQARAAAEAN